jgi:ribosomal protein L11 methylase PrmA
MDYFYKEFEHLQEKQDKMTNKGIPSKTPNRAIKANRPKPITGDIEVVPFDRQMQAQVAIDALIDGYMVLIVDYYSSGLLLLNALKKHITKSFSDPSFKGQRDFRQVYHQLSNQILIEIDHNKISVKKAPAIGWLKKLYPEVDDFLLPFTQVQGLNSSWQWYEKGISIPVLADKIHPYFGTYFPTRFEHLFLFEDWLKSYDNKKESAIDIGIGSGILSLQLLNHGFGKIYGTDSNPNAIIGLKETLRKEEKVKPIELIHGDLFAGIEQQSELIVFNPPWIPATHQTEGIDKAIYYDANLFDRFFEEAIKHLAPNGRVVLLFSNLAQITKTETVHPIKKEIAEGGRFEKELLQHRKVHAASKHTRRNQSWRNHEMVELWVLRAKTNGC